MIKKRLTDIESAWDNAKDHMYDEIIKKHGPDHMKGKPTNEVIEMMEQFWAELFDNRLVLRPWLYDNKEFTPYIEFSSDEELTFFILKYSTYNNYTVSNVKLPIVCLQLIGNLTGERD